MMKFLDDWFATIALSFAIVGLVVLYSVYASDAEDECKARGPEFELITYRSAYGDFPEFKCVRVR